MKTLTTLIACGLLAQSAYAQHGSGLGNGGDALICDGGTHVYLLDYVEGLGRGFRFRENDSATTRQMVNEAFTLLQKKLDYRGFAYEKMKDEMLNDIEAFQGQEYLGTQVAFTNDILPDVPDSQELSLPPNCAEKKQLVVQRQTSAFPEDRAKLRNFRIYAPLWVKMSAYQRAMTIMHEILFWDQINDHASDSRNARYLNQKIMSQGFNDLNPCQWLGNLDLAGVQNLYGAKKEVMTKSAFSLIETSRLIPVYNDQGDGRFIKFINRWACGSDSVSVTSQFSKSFTTNMGSKENNVNVNLSGEVSITSDSQLRFSNLMAKFPPRSYYGEDIKEIEDFFVTAVTQSSLRGFANGQSHLLTPAQITVHPATSELAFTTSARVVNLDLNHPVENPSVLVTCRKTYTAFESGDLEPLFKQFRHRTFCQFGEEDTRKRPRNVIYSPPHEGVMKLNLSFENQRVEVAVE